MGSVPVGVLVTVGLTIIAGIVWAIRLEGRHSAHERECIEYRKRMDERTDRLQRMLEHMDSKLDRVVERVSPVP